MITSRAKRHLAAGSANSSAGLPMCFVYRPGSRRGRILVREVEAPLTGGAKVASEINLRRGCVRVTDLARRAGLGTRQFERRFRHEVGIPPKLYIRIARFEAALRFREAAPEMRWTDIAHDLRYHDQMHMVHDFN